MTHPRSQLDKESVSPLRLSIAAAVNGADSVEFSTIRDAVQITDAELSRQITRLSAAGYLSVTKAQAGRYSRTWLALTESGRAALRTHVAALKAITGDL